MKILNTLFRGRLKHLKHFLELQTQEIFSSAAIDDPEEELKKQIKDYFAIRNIPIHLLGVFYMFGLKGDIVKIYITYGEPVKSVRIRVAVEDSCP